jgi:hypothetical protein
MTVKQFPPLLLTYIDPDPERHLSTKIRKHFQPKRTVISKKYNSKTKIEIMIKK